MSGISIPIGGDMAPFAAMISQLKAEMQKLSAEVRASLRPAAAETAKIENSGNAAAGGLVKLAKSASEVGFVLTNVVSGAKAVRSIFGFLRNLPPGWRKVTVGIAATGVALVGIVGAIKLAQAAFTRLISIARRGIGAVVTGARSAANGLRSAIGSIASAIPGGSMIFPVAGIVGGLGALTLAASQFKQGLDVAGDLERTQIALQSLTGSTQVAKDVLGSLKQSWMETGVEVSAQAASVQKFIALGFSPKDAVQLQGNILDVAGAVGLSASEAALLGTALAQVKAKGVVSMEELRGQIAEKGIPVFEALAAKLGVTKSALIDMVSDGKVPADALLDIFLNMEGRFGQFAGGAAKMGQSFSGMLSRVKAAWQLLLAEFAAPIATDLKPILDMIIEKIGSFKETAATAGKAIGDVLLGVFAMIKSGRTMEILGAGLKVAFMGAVDVMWRGIRGVVAFLAAAIPPIFSAAFQKLTDPLFWSGLRNLFESLGAALSAEIMKATGVKQSLVTAMRDKAGMNANLGFEMLNKAGGVTMGDLISDVASKGGDAFMKAFGGESIGGFKDALDEFKEKMASVSGEVAAMREKFASKDQKQDAGAQGPAAESPLGQLKNAMTLTTSLGRIGGGGFGMTFLPFVSEQKRTNKLLEKVVRNTSQNMTPAPAIV